MKKIFIILIFIAIISCIFNLKYTTEINRLENKVNNLEEKIEEKEIVLNSYDAALTEELNRKEKIYFDECFIEGE